MKSVWNRGLAGIVGLALLAGGPSFGKGDKDKRSKKRTNAAAATPDQKAADQKAADQKPAGQKGADPKPTDAATNPKPANNNAANGSATHTANKPVAPEGAMAMQSKTPLPKGWDKLNLTDDQKHNIDGAVQKYSAQINRLQGQIEQLKESQNAETMAFLTSEQKTAVLRAEGVIKTPGAMAANSPKSQNAAVSSTPNPNQKSAPPKRIRRNRGRRNQEQQPQPQPVQKAASQQPGQQPGQKAGQQPGQPSPQQPNAKSDKK